MFIARLHLSNFRNHGATSFAAGNGLVVLSGANGAGKTNILEGISLLAPGRGLRGAAFADMVRDGSGEGFAVSAECRAAGDPGDGLTIGTGIRADAPGRRRVRINQAECAASALGEWLAILWLTPAMDRLFVDGASQRRRFLDRMTLALMPEHARHATRYDAAMRARSRLLADEAPADPQWLAALEAQMGEHGAALDAARHRLVDGLAAELQAAPPDLFARPTLGLVGPDGSPLPLWQADTLAAALRLGRDRDARAGRALAGPHRSDLSVIHAEKGQAAARCSTGEQKAMLLSMVLAHGDIIARARGARPILLLDELAAHLDPQRRAALFDRLAAGGGQVWMTGTEPGLFDAVPAAATRLVVDYGQIMPA